MQVWRLSKTLFQNSKGGGAGEVARWLRGLSQKTSIRMQAYNRHQLQFQRIWSSLLTSGHLVHTPDTHIAQGCKCKQDRHTQEQMLKEGKGGAVGTM